METYIEKCPLCGSEPQISHEDNYWQGRTKWTLACPNCKDRLGTMVSKDDLIKTWNGAVRGYQHFNRIKAKRFSDGNERKIEHRQRFEELGFSIYLDGARDFQQELERVIKENYDDYDIPQEIIDKAQLDFEAKAR